MEVVLREPFVARPSFMSGIRESLLDLSAKQPYDPRFANHNVMKSCWLSYVQFHNCWANNQDESENCSKLAADKINRCTALQVGAAHSFLSSSSSEELQSTTKGKGLTYALRRLCGTSSESEANSLVSLPSTKERTRLTSQRAMMRTMMSKGSWLQGLS